MTENLTSELSFTVAQRSVAGKKTQNEDAIGIRLPKGATLINKGAVFVISNSMISEWYPSNQSCLAEGIYKEMGILLCVSYWHLSLYCLLIWW